MGQTLELVDRSGVCSVSAGHIQRRLGRRQAGPSGREVSGPERVPEDRPGPLGPANHLILAASHPLS